MANFLRVSFLVLLNFMIRRPKYGIVDINEVEGEEDDKISFCKHCLESGFQVPLKGRIYPEGQSIPNDSDQWMQCHECGEIYADYEIQKEPVIYDFVETIDNPFDIAKDSMLGLDNRKASRKKRQKPNFDHIKELDLKNDLKRGCTLLHYFESQPQ